jgi:hypothetical protein
MPGPITPDEVQPRKNETIPEEVFEVFNALIVENWDGRSARITQDEAVSRVSKALGISRSTAFSRKLLDIEDVYRKAGWKVVYDKPAYNEDYEAFFVFSKK